MLPTPSQTVGPFFGVGFTDANVLVAPDDARARRLDGRVLDGAGVPVPDAVVEVFAPDVGFGRSVTDDDGRYWFIIAEPDARDGQAPHLEVSVFARGLLQRVATRLYFPEQDAANSVDPVLRSIDDERVRSTLVAAAVGDGVQFDIHLQGPEETAFFEL
jgi:protocatechuate 3,4-dioxygenase alpha subunit